MFAQQKTWSIRLALLALLTLLAFANAATSQRTHTIDISIKAVAELRLTADPSYASVDTAAVSFDPEVDEIVAAGVAAYDIDADTTNFSRVSYLVNRSTFTDWNVYVKSTGIPTFPTGLTLSDIKLIYQPNDTDGDPTNNGPEITYALSATDQLLDSATTKTSGFRSTSLAYRLHLDGDEAEGTSSGLVIQYSLVIN